MKAIYESKQRFLQLSYGDVNRHIPVMEVSFSDSKMEYKNDPHTVGAAVKEELYSQRAEFYTFSAGENNNQLILTDPTEIRNMREYINRRGEKDDLITEVSFEGNEADLYEPVEVAPEEIKEKPKHDEGIDYNSLSDWDKEMLSRMSK